MFEQDYLMRLIKEMVRALIKMLFDIDTKSPSAELLEEQADRETLNQLTDMVDGGNINEAENELYELTEEEKEQDFKIGLLFYAYLNEKDDEFLHGHGFSREEVKLGLKNLVSKQGLGSMVDVFLEDGQKEY